MISIGVVVWKNEAAKSDWAMIRSARSRIPEMLDERAGGAAVIGDADRFAKLLGHEQAEFGASRVGLVHVNQVGVGQGLG